jgi:hypothetical protein
VTSHSHAMPRPCPAPRPAPSRLARHARPGASRHGRARSETRPPPGQSGFAPRRRQPPVAIHSRHFRMDAGRAKAAPPTRRPGAWRVDPRRRRPARPRRNQRRRRDGCGRSATAPGGIAAPTAPPLPAAAGGGRLPGGAGRQGRAHPERPHRPDRLAPPHAVLPRPSRTASSTSARSTDPRLAGLRGASASDRLVADQDGYPASGFIC